MNCRHLISTAVLLACLFSVLPAQTAQIQPLAVVDEPLPALDAGVDVHVPLHASGGVPPYVWSVPNGDLPEGLRLTPEGVLEGRPAKPGASALTLKVEDSGHPTHTITKDFKIVVSTPLLLEWADPPKVHENRIDGSVQVSNGSTSAFDLTVVIVAVADNGRATAIGYQHIQLKEGAASIQIPFGNTLPYGGYTIHADAIAEIPAKNAILRRRLQTPQPLQILQGP